MIDFSKINVGDKVLIEATVTLVDTSDDKYPLKVSYKNYANSEVMWPFASAIASHIPCGPEVGDEVSLGEGGVSRFQVIGIEGGEAWLRRMPGPVSGCQRTTVYKLSDLTVTKRKSL